MNFLEKVKEIVAKEGTRKTITNLSILLIVGILILIIASTFTDDKNDNLSQSLLNEDKSSLNNEYTPKEDYAKEIEEKLKNILSKIEGAGNVDVMITLEDTAERLPAFNTTKTEEKTEEKDTQGGTRTTIKTDQSEQVVTGNNNEESFVIIKEVKPRVRGVIVVSEGASDIAVKERLYSAVKTVLGISGNRVDVYASQ